MTTQNILLQQHFGRSEIQISEMRHVMKISNIPFLEDARCSWFSKHD